MSKYSGAEVVREKGRGRNPPFYAVSREAWMLQIPPSPSKKAHQRWAFFNGESEEEHPSAGAMMRLQANAKRERYSLTCVAVMRTAHLMSEEKSCCHFSGFNA